MTSGFDKTVRDIAKVIGKNACLEQIENVVRAANVQPGSNQFWPPLPSNADDKKTAKSVALAIGKLERKLLGRPGQDSAIEAKHRNKSLLTSGEEQHLKIAALIVRATYWSEFYEWAATLKFWREQFEAFSGAVLAGSGDIFKPIEDDTLGARPDEAVGTNRTPSKTKTRAWPLGHRKKSTETLLRKRSAVGAAATILDLHGISLTVTRKSSAFYRVAALLFGDKNKGGLEYQCREFLKTRKQRFK